MRQEVAMKSVLLVAIVVMSSVLVSSEEAAEHQESVEGETEWRQDFLVAIKAGFDRDLADEPKASWLGSGTLEVLHSEGMPEVGITRREGNLEATSQVSLEEIKQARESAGITSRKFAAWAAWKNANGEVNLAISSPLSEQEVVAIKSLASTTWKVFPVKSFIGPSLVANSWAWKTPYYLSHINMGSSEFQAGLEALRSMRVIENAPIKCSD